MAGTGSPWQVLYSYGAAEPHRECTAREWQILAESVLPGSGKTCRECTAREWQSLAESVLGWGCAGWVWLRVNICMGLA